MVLVYATPDDLAAWTGTTAPTNATALLRSASLAVREATELCFYAVDDTGLPTNTTQLQAFNDATCCQAAALAELDVNPQSGGVVEAGVVSSSKLGSASFEYADAAIAAAAKAAAMQGLVPDALRILRDAGISPTNPWIVG